MLTLPNEENVYYIDKLTALYVYNEIFVDNQYLKYGIGVKEGDVVFDVGANIGLFSRFIANKAQNLKIFAFEPVPTIFKVLESNLEINQLPYLKELLNVFSKFNQDNHFYFP